MAVKILVVGPEQSGKTCIANALANVVTQSPEEGESLRDLPYRPTAAVRVVECDVQLAGQQSRRWDGARSVEVELWDVSGNTKFESCWPAIQRDVDGVLVVYNAENPSHSAEVETWYEWFVDKAGLRQEQCLIFANDRNSGHDDPRGKPPVAFDECEFLYTDANDAEKMRSAFQDFVGALGAFRHSD